MSKEVNDKVSFAVTAESVKRVIAPYVNIVRYDKSNNAIRNDIEIPLDTNNFFLEKRPSDLVKDLTTFLTNRYDVTVLNETAQLLKTLTKSAGVTLYIVDTETNELVHSSYYVSNQYSYLRWSIEQGSIVAAYVALTKESLVIDNILTDSRFPNGIPFQDDSVRAVLCVPVVTCDSDCYAVIELYRTIESNVYSIDDLKLMIVVTGWMALALDQYRSKCDFEEKVEVNNLLLTITNNFVINTQAFDQYISTILDCAKTRLCADRSSFYIIDPDSYKNDANDLFADVYVQGLAADNNTVFVYKKNLKTRLNEHSGIAGYAANRKQFLNIKDAYSCPHFKKDNDLKNGYFTQSILCMPVCSLDKVLGVIEIVNKTTSSHFSDKDETLFMMFSSYFELALNFANVQKNSLKKDHKIVEIKAILNDRLRPCLHDFTALVKNPVLKIVPADFDEFDWYVTDEYRDYMPQLCLHMLLTLNREWEKHVDTLSAFILTVRDCYRDVAYHNFEHAFNVMHCIYNILKRNNRLFSHTETKALLIAALCHDIDHPGFTNQYLNLSRDPLACLYDKSPLESHHWYLTSLIITVSLGHMPQSWTSSIVFILMEDAEFAEWQIREFREGWNCYKVSIPSKLEKTKFFSENLHENFTAFMHEIQTAILDTDLALYFQCRAKLYQICAEKQFDFGVVKHRELLKSIIMTACDLSGQSKPYAVAKVLTKSLYNEFYIQADKEKQLGFTPLSMMDPDKKNLIPQDQVQFLTVVCIPCTELLKNILPNTARLYQENLKLKSAWMEVCQMENNKFWKMEKSIPDSKDNEKYI